MQDEFPVFSEKKKSNKKTCADKEEVELIIPTALHKM